MTIPLVMIDLFPRQGKICRFEAVIGEQPVYIPPEVISPQNLLLFLDPEDNEWLQVRHCLCPDINPDWQVDWLDLRHEVDLLEIEGTNPYQLAVIALKALV